MEPNVDLITVPAGPVALSDRRSGRRWTVDVAAFQLAATPVTQALYAEVTGERPSVAHGDALPVEGVSWWDAIRFCNALSERRGLTPAYRLLPGGAAEGSLMQGTPTHGLSVQAASPAQAPSSAQTGSPAHASSPAHGRFSAGGRVDNEGRLFADGSLLPSADEPGVVWDRSADGYRLPTEAEWEHACRAGTAEPRYGPLDEIAWHRDNSGERIHEVGGKLPNSWGLHDTLGNAWDWCWDVYDAEIYGTYRVLRGGGWFDEHWSCRASVRRRSHPDLRIEDVSFRLARDCAGP